MKNFFEIVGEILQSQLFNLMYWCSYGGIMTSFFIAERVSFHLTFAWVCVILCLFFASLVNNSKTKIIKLQSSLIEKLEDELAGRLK